MWEKGVNLCGCVAGVVGVRGGVGVVEICDVCCSFRIGGDSARGDEEGHGPGELALSDER